MGYIIRTIKTKLIIFTFYYLLSICNACNINCYQCEHKLKVQELFLTDDIYKDENCFNEKQTDTMKLVQCSSKCFTGINIIYDTMQPTNEIADFMANEIRVKRDCNLYEDIRSTCSWKNTLLDYDITCIIFCKKNLCNSQNIYKRFIEKKIKHIVPTCKNCAIHSINGIKHDTCKSKDIIKVTVVCFGQCFTSVYFSIKKFKNTKNIHLVIEKRCNDDVNAYKLNNKGIKEGIFKADDFLHYQTCKAEFYKSCNLYFDKRFVDYDNKSMIVELLYDLVKKRRKNKCLSCSIYRGILDRKTNCDKGIATSKLNIISCTTKCISYFNIQNGVVNVVRGCEDKVNFKGLQNKKTNLNHCRRKHSDLECEYGFDTCVPRPEPCNVVSFELNLDLIKVANNITEETYDDQANIYTSKYVNPDSETKFMKIPNGLQYYDDFIRCADECKIKKTKSSFKKLFRKTSTKKSPAVSENSYGMADESSSVDDTSSVSSKLSDQKEKNVLKVQLMEFKTKVEKSKETINKIEIDLKKLKKKDKGKDKGKFDVNFKDIYEKEILIETEKDNIIYFKKRILEIKQEIKDLSNKKHRFGSLSSLMKGHRKESIKENEFDSKLNEIENVKKNSERDSEIYKNGILETNKVIDENKMKTNKLFKLGLKKQKSMDSINFRADALDISTDNLEVFMEKDKAEIPKLNKKIENNNNELTRIAHQKQSLIDELIVREKKILQEKTIYEAKIEEKEKNIAMQKQKLNNLNKKKRDSEFEYNENTEIFSKQLDRLSEEILILKEKAYNSEGLKEALDEKSNIENEIKELIKTWDQEKLILNTEINKISLSLTDKNAENIALNAKIYKMEDKIFELDKRLITQEAKSSSKIQFLKNEYEKLEEENQSLIEKKNSLLKRIGVSKGNDKYPSMVNLLEEEKDKLSKEIVNNKAEIRKLNDENLKLTMEANEYNANFDSKMALAAIEIDDLNKQVTIIKEEMAKDGKNSNYLSIEHALNTRKRSKINSESELFNKLKEGTYQNSHDSISGISIEVPTKMKTKLMNRMTSMHPRNWKNALSKRSFWKKSAAVGIPIGVISGMIALGVQLYNSKQENKLLEQKMAIIDDQLYDLKMENTSVTLNIVNDTVTTAQPIVEDIISTENIENIIDTIQTVQTTKIYTQTTTSKDIKYTKPKKSKKTHSILDEEEAEEKPENYPIGLYFGIFIAMVSIASAINVYSKRKESFAKTAAKEKIQMVESRSSHAMDSQITAESDSSIADQVKYNEMRVVDVNNSPDYDTLHNNRAQNAAENQVTVKVEDQKNDSHLDKIVNVPTIEELRSSDKSSLIEKNVT